ncbi:unnamed protein product [Paramecium pentaurelia]|uniref:Peptidase S49 domain-containing protein n=1 Tax=Paramecium pentaurelia TaxID=43138 RepID=A0A8S1TYS7_9CILI|nr:unnamed protein product [Paramecium pentaurelia]
MQTLLKLFTKPRIPIIRLSGVIKQQSGDKIQDQLDKIKSKNLCALAILINSPGGLPVQSDIICQKLNLFKQKHNIPIYTFAEDVAASGGYFVLCIGDKVFADQSSLIGSVGVISQWHGIKKALEKLGIEAKFLTSNDQIHEVVNSAFSDFNQEGATQWVDKLEFTHQMFINHVKSYRKNIVDQNVFKAEVYNGEQAKQLGLIDDFGNYEEILNKLHPGCKFEYVSFPTKMEELKQLNKA